MKPAPKGLARPFLAQAARLLLEVHGPRLEACARQLLLPQIWWRANPISNSVGNRRLVWCDSGDATGRSADASTLDSRLLDLWQLVDLPGEDNQRTGGHGYAVDGLRLLLVKRQALHEKVRGGGRSIER